MEGLYRDYIGLMEKKMEATIGFSVTGAFAVFTERSAAASKDQ